MIGPVVLLLVLWAVAPSFGQEWARFRGPNGSGIATDSGYPVEFDKTKNLIWRSPVRKGKSSPVLTETRIYLTAFEDEKLYTQCFDRATGELLWERFEARVREDISHLLNEPSSSTPVTDGENVYAFFGEFGLISYDPTGEVRWRLPLGPFTNSMGHSASLIRFDDSVILLADQQRNGFIGAYDLRNGELNWKVERSSSSSWSTPILFEGATGEVQVVTAANGEMSAHSTKTGKPVWVHPGTSLAVAPSPVMIADTVYSFGYGVESAPPFSTGLEHDTNKDGQISPEEYGKDAALNLMADRFSGPDRVVTREVWDAFFEAVSRPSALVAVRIDPETMETTELWRYERSFIGVVPSLIAIDGLLYLVKNSGILTSFDAETGEVVKAGRIRGAIDGYSASPVSADGRLYFATEGGHIAVVEAGRDWSVLAVNTLDEPMFATPALSKGHIYVRTDDALYRFGEKQ